MKVATSEEGTPPRVTSDQDQPASTAGPPQGDDEKADDEPHVGDPVDGAAEADPPATQSHDTVAPVAEQRPAEGSDTVVTPTDEAPGNGSGDAVSATDEAPAVEPDDEAPAVEPDDDSAVEPGDDSPAPSRTMFVGLSVLAVVVVGVLILVLATGGGDGGSPAQPSASTTRPPPVGPTLPAGAFSTFHDDLTGFTMQYPTSWQLAQAPVSEIRLVVTPGTGQGEAVSVRVNETQQVTTPENLANIKTVTDGTIATNPSAKVLKTDAITLNGLIGYYYLYTFKDSTSGLEGVHAHYFLFKGNRMYSMVFQVLPAEKFEQFAGVFDQMAQSFKVDPEPPPTTAPPAGAP